MSKVVAPNPAEGLIGLPGWRNNRWLQLIFAVIIQISIASVEYGWTKYAVPLEHKLHAPLPAVQYAFTVGIIAWGLGQPIVGYVVDRWGPRWTAVGCSLAVAIGWMMMGTVTTLGGLYFWYFVSGFGGGVLYGVSLGTSTRWFPDKRGLANGIVSAAFGAGSLVFLPVIISSMKTSVDSAFFNVGIVQIFTLLLMSFLLKWPDKKLLAQTTKKAVVKEEDLTPKEILGTLQFWMMWITFFAMQCGGLMLTANSAPYAKSAGVSAAFITIGLTAMNLGNGGSRVLWGWISDHIGRFKTMGIAFGLNAIVFLLFTTMAKSGVGFVVAMAIAFLTWGCVYSLFPTVSADVFGTSYQTVTYGMLYSAKSVAGVFGGGVGAAIAMTLGWQGSFTIAAAFAAFACLMAVFVIPRFGKQKRTRANVPTPSPADGGAQL